LNEIAIPLATSHGFLIFDYYKLRIPFPNDGDGELYYYHIRISSLSSSLSSSPPS